MIELTRRAAVALLSSFTVVVARAQSVWPSVTLGARPDRHRGRAFVAR